MLWYAQNPIRMVKTLMFCTGFAEDRWIVADMLCRRHSEDLSDFPLFLYWALFMGPREFMRIIRFSKLHVALRGPMGANGDF